MGDAWSRKSFRHICNFNLIRKYWLLRPLARSDYSAIMKPAEYD